MVSKLKHWLPNDFQNRRSETQKPMKKWQQRRAKVSATGNKMVLTTKMFLGKEGDNPIVTPDVLFEFNDNAREDDVNDMSAFFDLVKAGYKIIVSRKTRIDQGGNLYKYQNFNRNGNSDGAKVVNIGKIFEFIEGLYDNKFAINFTYDDLLEEAEQA
jgi:hypothetical protein